MLLDTPRYSSNIPTACYFATSSKGNSADSREVLRYPTLRKNNGARITFEYHNANVMENTTITINIMLVS